MSNIVDPLTGLIATRVRTERERRKWTLAQLAEASGVSRAMINRIERAESSPTAVILGKLSAAFELSVAALLTPAPDTDTDDNRTSAMRRHLDAIEWRDPATSYRRRQITGPQFPAEVAEIHLPPGAYIPYPAAAFAFVHQAIWVLDGRLTFHDGDSILELEAGDSIELGDPVERAFANTSDSDCRYAVILARKAKP